MLAINDKIIGREELCKKFGVDYNKIVKRPEFEGTQGWIDRANGGKKRFNSGYNKLARFWIEDKTTQMPMEVRYAQTRRFSKEADGYIYSPQRVTFDGEGMQLSEDLDLAVFAFLHPSCSLSPFQKGKSHFEYVDAQARADKKIKDLDALGEALVHAKSISGIDSVLLAKGLGIAGMEGRDQGEVTAALMDYAHKNPALYLEKKNQALTLIEGKIEHLVDKDVIHMEQIGQVRRWQWNSGHYEGQVILDIINTTVNAREALKNHMKSNLHEYMGQINNITEGVKAQDKALNYLNTITDESGQSIGNDLPDHLKSVGKHGTLPENFNDSIAYLHRVTGKRPSNVIASKFLKAVVEDGLQEIEVQEWIAENIKAKVEAE